MVDDRYPRPVCMLRWKPSCMRGAALASAVQSAPTAKAVPSKVRDTNLFIMKLLLREGSKATSPTSGYGHSLQICQLHLSDLKDVSRGCGPRDTRAHWN